jgi:hypothetical protein
LNFFLFTFNFLLSEIDLPYPSLKGGGNEKGVDCHGLRPRNDEEGEKKEKKEKTQGFPGLRF